MVVYVSKLRLVIEFMDYPFGVQVCPQLAQRLTVLDAPINPQKPLTPRAPVVIDVEPQRGQVGMCGREDCV